MGSRHPDDGESGRGVARGGSPWDTPPAPGLRALLAEACAGTRDVLVVGDLPAGEQPEAAGTWRRVPATGLPGTPPEDAARADLGYRPTADVIQRLRETGATWRAAHTTVPGARP